MSLRNAHGERSCSGHSHSNCWDAATQRDTPSIHRVLRVRALSPSFPYSSGAALEHEAEQNRAGSRQGNSSSPR
ncbi:hypothetical protein HaLaN_32039, partial [Haematococcus lacustris]